MLLCCVAGVSRESQAKMRAAVTLLGVLLCVTVAAAIDPSAAVPLQPVGRPPRLSRIATTSARSPPLIAAPQTSAATPLAVTTSAATTYSFSATTQFTTDKSGTISRPPASQPAATNEPITPTGAQSAARHHITTVSDPAQPVHQRGATQRCATTLKCKGKASSPTSAVGLAYVNLIKFHASKPNRFYAGSSHVECATVPIHGARASIIVVEADIEKLMSSFHVRAAHTACSQASNTTAEICSSIKLSRGAACVYLAFSRGQSGPGACLQGECPYEDGRVDYACCSLMMCVVGTAVIPPL